MNSCETYQAQMLEYLYDLLDDGERQALQAHLGSCPACQAALVRAQAQRRLLAAAAKMEFATVHFTPPAAATEAAAVVPLPTRRRAWPRWAVAAAVLLALAGLSVPGYWYGSDYR